jgi:hypothetical protein
MKHGKKSYYERFMEMTDEQRDAEVEQFDKEIPGLPGKALTKSERALLRRAKRKGGRPRVGQGARRVLITVEQGLLKKADTYAKNKGMTRSELIARGLRSVIGSAA